MELQLDVAMKQTNREGILYIEKTARNYTKY